MGDICGWFFIQFASMRIFISVRAFSLYNCASICGTNAKRVTNLMAGWQWKLNKQCFIYAVHIYVYIYKSKIGNRMRKSEKIEEAKTM